MWLVRVNHACAENYGHQLLYEHLHQIVDGNVECYKHAKFHK